MYLFILAIIAIVVQGGVTVFLIRSHYKEKKEIFDRFLAKDLHDYKYHEDEYKSDIDHKKATYKKMEEERPTEEQIEAKKKSEGF